MCTAYYFLWSGGCRMLMLAMRWTICGDGTDHERSNWKQILWACKRLCF
jgi:hypothetical protein